MKQLIWLIFLLVPNLKANNENIGNVLQFLVPSVALATTLYLDDKEGESAFYKSYASTILTTYALKYTVKAKRPDSNNLDSFPSGHTSSAFAGASFINARYGFKYAIVPYIASIFTAYSRVQANRHFTRDVVAGAAIAILSSYYFVLPYKKNKVSISLQINNNYHGLNISYKF